MSEADIYEKLAKLNREVLWIKERLAQRFGIREGAEYDMALAEWPGAESARARLSERLAKPVALPSARPPGGFQSGGPAPHDRPLTPRTGE